MTAMLISTISDFGSMLIFLLYSYGYLQDLRNSNEL